MENRHRGSPQLKDPRKSGNTVTEVDPKLTEKVGILHRHTEASVKLWLCPSRTAACGKSEKIVIRTKLLSAH